MAKKLPLNPKLEPVNPKIDFVLSIKESNEDILGKLKGDSEKKERTPEEQEELEFGRALALYFFQAKLKLPNSPKAIPKDEKAKNIYIGEMFYRKVKNKKLDIDIEENEDFIYSQLGSIEFWKDKIDFMFKYADLETLKWYSQTVNGVIRFYFNKYQQLKNVVEGNDLNAEERKLIALIRQWKKEDAINCFYCYIVRLYRYLKPTLDYPNRQIYFNYIKFLCNSPATADVKTPIIKPLTLENSALLRGLLLQFKDRFQELCLIKGVDISTLFNYKEFEELCEIKGVDFEDSVLLNKDLNTIIGEAMMKFTVVN